VAAAIGDPAELLVILVDEGTWMAGDLADRSGQASRDVIQGATSSQRAAFVRDLGRLCASL
jgi:hypothetical protein